MTKDKKPDKMPLSEEEFYSHLRSIINGKVHLKSEEVLQEEAFWDKYGRVLTSCYEDAHKLDILPDDITLASLIEYGINAPIRQIKAELEKPWLKNKLNIALVGPYSAGKTSILNNLLSESLPINDNENTALAT